jgi:hypothetical protein
MPKAIQYLMDLHTSTTPPHVCPKVNEEVLTEISKLGEAISEFGRFFDTAEAVRLFGPVPNTYCIDVLKKIDLKYFKVRNAWGALYRKIN